MEEKGQGGSGALLALRGVAGVGEQVGGWRWVALSVGRGEDTWEPIEAAVHCSNAISHCCFAALLLVGGVESWDGEVVSQGRARLSFVLATWVRVLWFSVGQKGCVETVSCDRSQ